MNTGMRKSHSGTHKNYELSIGKHLNRFHKYIWSLQQPASRQKKPLLIIKSVPYIIMCSGSEPTV